jgi:RNA polymerase sigma factor (TIGR02999 family)
MTDVTQILSQIEAGDPAAAERLLPLVYDELRRLAAVRLAQEKPGQTLDATALVHEAYLRLAGGCRNGACWDNRGHFFAAAGEAMRRILIENARRKCRQKRGGQFQRVELKDLPDATNDEQLLSLDDALSELAKEDPRAAQVVELHHFAGLSHECVAEVLATSVYDARQKWTYARAWLLAALKNA